MWRGDSPIRRQFSARFHKHKKPISITFSIRGGFFGLSMQHETAAAGNICCCCCSSNSCCCYKFVAARISFIETLIAHVKITARCHLAQFGGRPPKWICVFCCSSVFSSFQTLVQVAFAFPLFFPLGSASVALSQLPFADAIIEIWCWTFFVPFLLML